MVQIQFRKNQMKMAGFFILIAFFIIGCQPNGRLMLSIADNDLEKARKILLSGVDIEIKNSSGESYIHYAASRGTPAMLNELKSHGAKVDVVSYFGQTPLHRAAGSGKLANMKWLLNEGLDPLARNKWGSTILHRAAGSNKPNVEVIDWILENTDLSVDDLNDDSQTPLMYGAEYGHIENVKYLLKQGANPQLVDDQNLFSVDFSKRENRQDVVTLFPIGDAQ